MKQHYPSTPKAVEDCHELLAWIIPKLDQFPRNRRFTLGERIENGLLLVLENLIQATFQKPHVAGWLGHACQAHSRGLCKAILGQVYFAKGNAAGRSPGGSGRVVEQQTTEPPVG